MEQHPLGKAEWIKFYGLLLDKSEQANTIFSTIETAYLEAQKLASSALTTPTVLSGALYRDIWYMPGGQSWGATFLKDAHAQYIWGATPETGSLSLSLEAVLDKAHNADFWIAPSEYTSYQGMQQATSHYQQFKPFRERKIFSYAQTKGPSGGMLYFELGPARPDLVLKDLIYYLHPGLLTNYEPVFFKPLQ
jgi:iron complex transport system substrate-binding protein